VHPLVMDRPSDETGWSGLPGELLEGRLLSFHGPSELCRLAGVCRSWRVACTSRAADEGCWKKLCWAAFPTMAGKLEEDVAAAAAVAREVVGGDEKESSLPSMFWKEKFAQRHLKQLAWHAEKLGQQQLRQRRAGLHTQQIAAADKQRDQDLRGQDCQVTVQRSGTRAARTRTCRRCAASFLPGCNPSDACRWHRGQYVHVDEHGVQEAACSAANMQQSVRQAIRANGRKKKSKQANMVFPGQARHVDLEHHWSWSCCGAESMVAPGCTYGCHT